MNRRGFLGLLGGVGAGLALDPDLALWMPGQKTYFDMAPPPSPLREGDWVAWFGNYNGRVYAGANPPTGYIYTDIRHVKRLDRQHIGPIGVFIERQGQTAIVQTSGVVVARHVMIDRPWQENKQRYGVMDDRPLFHLRRTS